MNFKAQPKEKHRTWVGISAPLLYYLALRMRPRARRGDAGRRAEARQFPPRAAGGPAAARRR
jgi:hypothetical protein